MIDNPKSILSWTQYNDTVTHEFAGSDVSSDELVQAFYGLLVGIGFTEEGILTEMKNFAEERLEILQVENSLLESE